jgi:hypothetical protein
MQRNSLKFILALLVVGQLALPFSAFAAINPVPTSDSGSTIENTAFTVALAPILVTNSGCLLAEQTYDKTDSTAQLGFSGLSIIGGDSVLLAQLAAKITAYNGFLTCRQGVLTSLSVLPTPNSYTYAQKQTYISQQNAIIAAYKSKLEAAQARYNNAKQGFWKTLVFNILIKTSKAVADSLVNKLVSNYKIANIKQYTDSVATLMYDNQFLRDNFPNAQGQLMARAILENPSFRTQIPPGIFVAADQALGFNVNAVSTSDPNYYQKMAMVGSAQANPYFQHSMYIGGVDQAHSTSLAYAQTQVANSNGYKAPVNCAGSLAQQKQIDQQTKAASDFLANRQGLLVSLQNNPKTSAADLAKAQADYQSALNAWNNIPFTVTGTSSVSSLAVGGGNNTEGTAAIVMCEAISSPAVLVNQGIDAVIKGVGGNISQYNDNNLPGFITIIGNVASQIGSSLILGGTGAAKTAALANEDKTVSAVVAVADQAVYSNMTANLAKGVDFEASPTGQPNNYGLSWSVITDQIPTASFVTISGDGISTTITDPVTKKTTPNKLALTAGTSITTTVGGNYILTVFDATGRAMTAVTITITPTTAINYNANSPTVAGAYTGTPVYNIRGPEKTLSLRGQ